MANTSTKSENKKSDFENQASNLADQAKSAAQNVGEKARQAGEYARDKADSAVSGAGKGMESLAGTIRDRGPQEGLLGKATSGVANTLDSAGRYLDEHGMSGMVDDMTSMIRNHPLPAVLIGVGIGFMLARLTSTSSRSY
jgi:ElaB/YqjD/DUF883 family membrane-anchored ribosome-binding protein